MTGPTNTGNEAPREGLSAPESAQDPDSGTERRPGGLNGAETDAQGRETLRGQLRAALRRFIDPEDDCMPALSDDGVGFTWVTTDSVLDDLIAALDGEPAATENRPRHLYEAAIRATWNGETMHMDDAIRIETDAVLAVRDRELEQLREQLAARDAALAACTAQLVHDQAALARLRHGLADVITDMHATTGARHWIAALDSVLNPAHDDGPTVADCREADRCWPLQKGGE